MADVRKILKAVRSNKTAIALTLLDVASAVCSILAATLGSSSCPTSVIGISAFAFICAFGKIVVATIMYFKDMQERRRLLSTAEETASNAREAVVWSQTNHVEICVNTLGSNVNFRIHQCQVEIGTPLESVPYFRRTQIQTSRFNGSFRDQSNQTEASANDIPSAAILALKSKCLCIAH